jgi:hypothetical protein
MPPPPAIGSVRPSNADAPKDDDSTTARWIARDTSSAPDEPRAATQSRARPVAATRPVVPAPPPVGPSSSPSGLRAPSLGPSTTAEGPGDSAGTWLRTEGWDLDDDAGSSAATSTPAAAATSTPAAAATKSAATGEAKPGGKELGPMPAGPKLGAKEPGSVPSMPKRGGAARGPLPRPRVTPKPSDDAPLFGATDEVEPLFGRTSSTAATDARADAGAELDDLLTAAAAAAPAIDASAPPTTSALLDALPSFDAAPSSETVPEDGVPVMDANALLGAAMAPAAPYEPLTPIAAEIAPIGGDDDEEPAAAGPRLPVPGMLRDGGALAAADFRAAPRAPRSQPAAAMPPPRGMVPPKRSEDEPHLRAGDTRSFVAQVAEELMEEVERHRAVSTASNDAADEDGATHEAKAPHRDAEAAPVAAAKDAPRPAVVPIAQSPGPAPAVAAKRRSMGLLAGALGLAAVIGLVWANRDAREPAAPQTAAATALEPAATASPAGRAEPSLASPIAATADGAARDDDGVAGADAPSPEPAEDAMAAEGGGVAAAAAADVEAEPASADEAAAGPTGGGATRKSSGRSKSSSGGKASEGDGKPEPAAPKADAPASAEKLLEQARAAYKAGKGSTAYSLAAKSNRLSPSGDAAEVMALAACQMHDADKAKAALKNVPLFRRGPVRSTCKSTYDVKLGL